ncbi:MAG TPA: hypothetical protein P5556_09705 [Candidatus Gastranaerophilales bacterium]|nr:hypothetical protein [Candidatus Gastranaerophilales bacterium]
MEIIKPKVTICMPHFSPLIYTEVFAGIAGLMRNPNLSDVAPLVLPSKMSLSLAKIRNMLAKIVLEKTDSTHILWLDGDQLYPQGFIERLLAHDKDIVGTWTMNRAEEIPNCYIWNNEEKTKHIPVYPKGLTEVDRLGFGGIMTKVDVFKNLPEPWFSYDDKHVTEDLFFCDVAKKAGYKIFVDGDLRSQHIDQTYR